MLYTSHHVTYLPQCNSTHWKLHIHISVRTETQVKYHLKQVLALNFISSFPLFPFREEQEEVIHC